MQLLGATGSARLGGDFSPDAHRAVVLWRSGAVLHGQGFPKAFRTSRKMCVIRGHRQIHRDVDVAASEFRFRAHGGNYFDLL